MRKKKPVALLHGLAAVGGEVKDVADAARDLKEARDACRTPRVPSLISSAWSGSLGAYTAAARTLTDGTVPTGTIGRPNDGAHLRCVVVLPENSLPTIQAQRSSLGNR